VFATLLRPSWARSSMTDPTHKPRLLRRLVALVFGVSLTTQTALLPPVGESRSPLLLAPPQAEVHLGSQTKASLVVDTAIHSRLVRESPSQREQQRLTRLLAEHAGAWVTAVPSSLDGSDCICPLRSFAQPCGTAWA